MATKFSLPALPLRAPIRLVHNGIKGRARFRVAGLYRNGVARDIIENELRSSDGVRSVEASTITGSVLIWFEPSLSTVRIQRELNGAWKKAMAKRRLPTNSGNVSWHSLTPEEVTTHFSVDS